jgi:transmembrane 9 superfamily protein 2/4
MRAPKLCARLCQREVTAVQAQFINARIKENYVVNWLIDGLPVGHLRHSKSNNQDKQLYTIGFPLGVDDGRENPWFNNHYEIEIEYHHNLQKDKLRVVGITVNPIR